MYIEAHGGKIWGKNNYPEGKGATVRFSLPLHNEKLKLAASLLRAYAKSPAAL